MGLDALAKHYYPLLICLMLGIAAYFQASGINQLLIAAAMPSADPPSRGLEAAPRPPARDPDRDLSAASILARNPFDSVTGPLTASEAAPPSLKSAASSADPYDDPPCDIARAVLIVSADDPTWSFAAITGPDGKTVFRRRDEEFYGGKVDFIGDRRPADLIARRERGSWDRVWLVGPTGFRCQLKLGVKPPAMAAGKPPPNAPPGSAGGLPPALNGKIRQIGQHEFDVERSAVDALLANPADLMKTRVVPDKDGVKLFGIKPNTLLGALGIENGDKLVSINGFEMNDPQKMLEAYSKLMRADRVSASVIRNGKPMTIDFNIK